MIWKARKAANSLLVFVHIPKAGGMSMTGVLRQIYGDQLLIAHPLRGWPQEWSDETRDLISERKGFFRAFSGHYAYGVHELFERPARYFTIVRDPMARLESYYNFVRRWEIHHHHERANALDIADFFQWMIDINDIEVSNLQCLMVAGDKKFASAKNCINKHFDFAIPITKIVESLPVLARTYGWRKIPVMPRENSTMHLSRLNRLSDKLLGELIDLNAEDKLLYDYCESNWQEATESKVV